MQKPKLGRPPKIKNEKQLEKLIEEYIDSCYITEVDSKGVEYQKNIHPITLRGFCVFACIYEQTLIDWKNDREDLHEPIKKLRTICHNYNEQQLYTNNRTVGVIFSLKNNWGWSDQKIIEVKSNNLKFDFDDDIINESTTDN